MGNEMNKTHFLVDYFYKRQGTSGHGARIKIQGSVQFNLQTASSDFAVMDYLKKRHDGYDINIMSIKWI